MGRTPRYKYGWGGYILPACDTDPERAKRRGELAERMRGKMQLGGRETRRDVAELHIAGMPMSEIASVTKLSPAVVHDIVSAYLSKIGRPSDG